MKIIATSIVILFARILLFNGIAAKLWCQRKIDICIRDVIFYFLIGVESYVDAALRQGIHWTVMAVVHLEVALFFMPRTVQEARE